MARWEAGTRERLRDAALGLFEAHGYAATTVDDIAAAAGVTQRTFFRHFADKEEVLFDEDLAMERVLVEALAAAVPGEAPDSLAALVEVVRSALRALADTFEDERDRHRRRWAVVVSVPALHGRQLVKQERWTAALRTGLVQRGADHRQAAAAVELAAVGLRLAYGEWVAGRGRRRLRTLLDDAEHLLDEGSARERND